MATTLRRSLLTSLAVLLILSPSFGGAASIGVYHRRQVTNHPSSQSIVSKIQEHNFFSLIINEPDPDVLWPLRDSGISLTIGVRNQEILRIASSFTAAQHWIQTNIVPFSPLIQLKYIAVGDSAIGGSDAPFVLIAMMNLQKALESIGLDKTIKVSTSVSTTSILSIPSNRPSLATFTENSRIHMAAIAWFLARNNAPLLVDVFPYYNYIQDHNQTTVSLCHSLLNAPCGRVAITDGPLEYENLFDVILDSVYAAMEKVGVGNVPVIVSKTGWPSAGPNNAATADNAKTYAINLIKHLNSGRGTPRRPRQEIEVHFYVMYANGVRRSNREEFGLFYPDNKPVYSFPIL